jgi:hypothetical protein
VIMVIDDDDEVMEDSCTLSYIRCSWRSWEEVGGWNALVWEEGGRGDE